MSANYLLLIPIILLLDALLGEPKRWHPLIGFGCWVKKIEWCLYSPNFSPYMLFLFGGVGWLLLVLPIAYGVYLLEQYFGFMMTLLVGYLAIGAHSLKLHALQIAQSLQQGDLQQARLQVGYIVSRDTHHLDENEISCSAIESVLENGSDAIFSALFWFAIGGGAGILVYRLTNTLDAMWGYRNARYEYFGKYAARMDDILNWVPARLTALSYLFVGHSKTAWQCWKEQASHWYSPNAGVVMATGAGALNLKLGGKAFYQGIIKYRPLLGMGNTPSLIDIYRAWSLVAKSMLLWSVLSLSIGCTLWVMGI